MILYMWDTIWFWWIICIEYLQYMSFIASVFFLANLTRAIRWRCQF